MYINYKYQVLQWFVVLNFFILIGCNNEEVNLREKYKKEISEAIQEANKASVIQNDDKANNDFKLTNKKVRADIYNNGQYVRLTYKNAEGKWEQSAYERLKNGHYKLENAHRFKKQKPTYTENSHIGKNTKHSHLE